MTEAELDLLQVLCERRGRVLSRRALVELTRGRAIGPFERSIDILISRLRRKIEADPHHPDIIKTVRAGGYMLTPMVEDDGPGIPDGQKDAMLEPFVRGDAARRMDGHVGFGLGLSIAHAVVTAHGGTLALLDRRPTGLVAKIELPAGREAAAPAITI